MIISKCAGTYENGNIHCDGNKNENGCMWRLRCIHLGSFCKKNGLDVSKFIAGKSIKDVERILDYEYDDVIEPIGDVDSFPIPDEAYELMQHFEDKLCEKFGNKRVIRFDRDGIKPRRIVFTPGTFYPVDRLETSKYLVWFCKSETDYDYAIATLRYRPRYMSVEIQLPFFVEEIEEHLENRYLEAARFSDMLDGKYKSIVRQPTRTVIGAIVSMIKKLEDSGDFLNNEE